MTKVWSLVLETHYSFPLEESHVCPSGDMLFFNVPLFSHCLYLFQSLSLLSSSYLIVSDSSYGVRC